MGFRLKIQTKLTPGGHRMNTNSIPTMMTIPEIARTGLLPEHALRVMVKTGEIPAVYSGTKAFINYDNLVAKLSKLGAVEEPTMTQSHTSHARHNVEPRHVYYDRGGI